MHGGRCVPLMRAACERKVVTQDDDPLAGAAASPADRAAAHCARPRKPWVAFAAPHDIATTWIPYVDFHPPLCNNDWTAEGIPPRG